MKIIGLTGMSGSGKGYVCSIFEKKGIPSADSDSIVHALYSENKECINALSCEFGPGVVGEDGTIDRSSLRDIVFSDKSKLKKLNRIVHRFVAKEIFDIADEYKKNGAAAFIIDAPMLFESGIDRSCDIIISVIADRKTRIDRICRRDGISRQAAVQRLKNQHTDGYFIRRSDHVIYNKGEDVEAQVERILAQIKTG